jgi:cytochrome P450
MTFFLAANFTTALSTSNLIMYLIQPKHNHYLNEVRQEIKDVIIEPYLQANNRLSNISDEPNNAITYYSVWDLKKYSIAFNETLRLCPTNTYSSSITITEDLQIGHLFVKKGEIF